MSLPKKLTTQQNTEQEQVSIEATNQAQAAQEFQTVEELLRHDALHTPVPPSIEHRLQASLEQNPIPPRPWWRRWLGR